MVDTHCHLIDPQFVRDFADVVHRAQAAGLKKIVNAGYDVETSAKAMVMAKEQPWLVPAIGIHPNEAAAEWVKQMVKIEAMLSQGEVFAIGETGLDYYRDFSPREAQKELFRLHIGLARTWSLPLIVHTRNSLADAISILRSEDFHRGVFHCFSGSIEQAEEIIGLGFYVSFAGILTFSKRAREIFGHLPLDRLLLETDAPFLAPLGHRGKRNEPAYIIETLHSAAHILDMRPEKLEAVLDANAQKLFAFS